MSLMPTSHLSSPTSRSRDARTIERSGPAETQAVDQSAHKACLETIRELREENAILRQSADQFAALAERLQIALGRERARAAREASTPARVGATDPASIAMLIEAEYRAIPNLRLTRWQAARLWNLDQTVCDTAIATLLDKRVLREASGGFIRLEQ